MTVSTLFSALLRRIDSGVRSLPERLRGLLQLMLPLALFVLIDQLALVLTPLLHLPLPSSLIGMLILAALLCNGLVQERWLAQSADLLQRHLAFFFVPFAVGLMAYGSLLRSQGLALLLVIGLSTAAGVLVAGWMATLPWPSPPEGQQS
jgi:holin-like protein